MCLVLTMAVSLYCCLKSMVWRVDTFRSDIKELHFLIGNSGCWAEDVEFSEGIIFIWRSAPRPGVSIHPNSRILFTKSTIVPLFQFVFVSRPD